MRPVSVHAEIGEPPEPWIGGTQPEPTAKTQWAREALPGIGGIEENRLDNQIEAVRLRMEPERGEHQQARYPEDEERGPSTGPEALDGSHRVILKGSWIGTGPVPGLDPSGASVAERHLAVFDDDRHGALATRVLEHLGERVLGRNVSIVDGVALPLVGLPGLGRIGSGVLSEDEDGLGVGHTQHYRLAGVRLVTCETSARS